MTIPKTLRIFFKYRPRLPGKLCRAAVWTLRVVAFLTEPAVVDRIVRHLELTFVAEKPPPAYVFEQVALVAAEESGDYELWGRPRGERPRLV